MDSPLFTYSFGIASTPGLLLIGFPTACTLFNRIPATSLDLASLSLSDIATAPALGAVVILRTDAPDPEIGDGVTDRGAGGMWIVCGCCAWTLEMVLLRARWDVYITGVGVGSDGDEVVMGSSKKGSKEVWCWYFMEEVERPVGGGGGTERAAWGVCIRAAGRLRL